MTSADALYCINQVLKVPTFLKDWKEIHQHLVAKRTRNLFDTELYDFTPPGTYEPCFDTKIGIRLDHKCMQSFNLLDGTPVLTLFDTGSTVNLISEDMVRKSPYLSSLPVYTCPPMTITNTTGAHKHDRFIEVCFRLDEDNILFTTALIIPDFGSVKFILSKNSMTQLEGKINLKSDVAKFHKKEFALRTLHQVTLKPNSSRSITVRSKLPGFLKGSDMLCRSFMPFSKYLPELFKLQFRRGYSIIRIANPTKRPMTLRANEVIGSVSLDLADRFNHSVTIASHSHEDIDGTIVLCSHDLKTCPLTQHSSHHEPLEPYMSHDYNIVPKRIAEVNAHQLNDGSSPFVSPLAEKIARYQNIDQSKMTTEEIYKLKRYTFPYLDHDDVRLSLPDKTIIERELDLTTDSVLTPDQRPMVGKLFYDIRECLSIHDNPSISSKRFVTLSPINLRPFYIKPYLTHPKEIKFAESELRKLQLMGILRRGSSEFLSPIMLIAKSHSGQKLSKAAPWRAVANFQYLNKHLPDVKFSYPDVKHVLHKIGRSRARIFSVLDLKHAFYSINLNPDSVKYTTVCGSPGSPSYQYLRLPQGLKVSPAYFTNLMNDIMSEMSDEDREFLECIMDDCVIFTPDFETHCRVLRNFLLKLKEYGLLLTINKIHAFRSSVKYMGLKLSSSSDGPIIQPLGSRIKSAQTLPIPATARGIKSFIGCVIYLSQFLPKLSELVKPINDILKLANAHKKELDKIPPLKEYQKGKGRGKSKSLNIQSFWTEEHTANFEKIKALIVKAPVLHLPNATGHFSLECDSSAKHVGAALMQEQNGRRVIVAYFSAVMPEPAKRYSATEIELCGLKKAIIHFQYLLKYSKFSVIMDHSALKRILGSKKQAKTNRIQKYLEELSDFTFDFKHSSGKNMFISDFLSRFSAPNYDEEPIPYLTSIKHVTDSNYMAYLDKVCQYDPVSGKALCDGENHAFPVTRSVTRQQGIVLPPLFDSAPPARKRSSTPPPTPQPKPPPAVGPVRRGRGRPRKTAAPPPEQLPPEQIDPVPDRQTAAPRVVSVSKRLPDRSPSSAAEPPLTYHPFRDRNVPPPNAYSRPRTRRATQLDLDKGIETLGRPREVEQTSAGAIPQFDAIPQVSEVLEPPIPREHFPSLQPLFDDPIRDVRFKSRKDVPSQDHLDKIIRLLEHKTAHEYNLPFSLKELTKAQRKDPFFSKFIQYLESDHLPSNATARKSVIAESDFYALFGGVLFRMVPACKNDLKYKLSLCIPLDLAHKIFELYHSGLLSSHQGITRTFYKIRQDFYIRNLYKHLYLYIMSCRICSARRNIPINEKQRAWADTSIADFSIFESLSMDIKVMPESTDGKHYLLVLRCNHSRFIITDALYTRKAIEVAESFFQNVICAHGTNIKNIYCDLDTAFKNSVMDYLLKTFQIKVTFCSVESHQSNPAERSIKSIGDLLVHYMATFGNKWSSIHRLAAFAVNTFPIGHLANLSSYEIVYGRPPPVLTDLTAQAAHLAKPKHYEFSDYLDFLTDRINHIRSIAKQNHNAMVAKRRTEHGQSSIALREFHEGDIVYCHFPSKTHLSGKDISSKKFQLTYVGPLFIYSRYDKFLYTLATIDGTVIDQLFHVSRLKKGFLRLGHNTVVKNIYDYRKAKEDAQKVLSTPHEKVPVPTAPQSKDKPMGSTHALWYVDPRCFFHSDLASSNNTEQHQSHDDLSPVTDLLQERYVFHSTEQIDTSSSYEVTKARYKFGNLQLHTILHTTDADDQSRLIALWQNIPSALEQYYIDFLDDMDIRIVGSKRRYLDYLFTTVVKLF